MCVCVDIYTCIYIYIYIYTHTHTYIYTHTNINVCVCRHIHVYIYMYTHTHTHIYIYMKLLLRKLHYISIDSRRMLWIAHLNFAEKSSFNFRGNFKFTLLLLLSLLVDPFCCNTRDIIHASCYLMCYVLTMSFLPVRVCCLLLDSFSLGSCAVSIISLMTIVP